MISKLPISVCIIAKDEEKHIENCLARLQPYGFEIIVTDTGSTDRTKELAAKYADKVLDFIWTDDFSAARNFCASHAANQWILALDCDEYIEKINVPALRKLLKAYPKLRGCLPLTHLLFRPDGKECLAKDVVPRLYHKRYYHYEKPIHEQLVSAQTDLPTDERSFQLPIEAMHYGYALPPDEMRRKQERNLKLLQQQLEAEGESSYLCFQIGQSELVLGHCDRAIACYEKGLTFGENPHLLYVQQMIEGLAKAYVMANREKDALALMEHYQPQCDSAKFTFYHACVLLDNGEKLKALAQYVKATMMHDSHMLGDELLYCYQHIIELYHDFGEDELSEVFRVKYEQLMQERYSKNE